MFRVFVNFFTPSKGDYFFVAGEKKKGEIVDALSRKRVSTIIVIELTLSGCFRRR